MGPLHSNVGPAADNETDGIGYAASVIDALDDAVVDVKADGTIARWNRAAERMFGYVAADAVGRPVSLIVPPENATEEERNRAEAGSGDDVRRTEVIRVRQDGERISVLLTVLPRRNSRGELVGRTEIARDLTEQKRIAAVAAQLRNAIDATPNGIVMIDDRGKIVMANVQMERLFGYTRSEMLGQTIELLIPERYRRAHPAQRDAYISSPEVRAMGHGRELFARRKDGTEFPVEVGLNPAHTPEGTFVLGAVIDITTRKKMEAELGRVHSDLQRHAQTLEKMVRDRTAHLQQTIAELEGVSYSLSHDLRGPLRTIQGFVQLVVEDAGDRLNAEERDLLGKAIKAAHRLDRLIQDVLTYTRVSRQTVALEDVDVERLLRQIVDERPELRSPRAELVIEGPLLPVRGHEASLTQVITNLLDNAVKFVPPERVPRIRIRSEAAGNDVELWFEDNGIGIPKEAQPRLFAIFQRVHDDKRYPGTGIGLAIVRKAVERMGGSVSLDSELGVGSRFCVRLPKGSTS